MSIVKLSAIVECDNCDKHFEQRIELSEKIDTTCAVELIEKSLKNLYLEDEYKHVCEDCYPLLVGD